MNYRMLRCTIAFITVLLLQYSVASGQNDLFPRTPAWKVLHADNWKGVVANDSGFILRLPGAAVYTAPGGNKGWYERGLMKEYDGVIDARHWYGIRFDLNLENDALFQGSLVIRVPGQKDRHNLLDSSSAKLNVKGRGWHTLTIPFSAFDYDRGQEFFLKFIRQISLTGSYANISGAAVAVRNIKLVNGNPLHLHAAVQSKPGEADSIVRYSADITNSASIEKQVVLSFHNSGWESMYASVTPAFVTLQPGETKALTIMVKVSPLVPQGAQETNRLVASTSDGTSVETMDFITLRRLHGPYLVHTDEGWRNVLAKTSTYEWAAKSLQQYIRRADEFSVPETVEGNIKTSDGTPAVFKSYLEQRFWPVAVAFKLTGNKKYAEKLALLLCRLAAPGAYPTTLHANSQGIPQEGGFWEGIARSYDLVKDAGVLSQKDKESIEQSMRLFIYTVEDGMGDGGISNWSVFNLCPAAQCALVLQDMHHFNYLMDGPCGIVDHIRYGVMDDGWWYEMSLSYNLGCAENMTSLGLAAQPFGINFLHKKFPVAATRKVGLRPFEFENFQGMAFGKFGPVRNNYIDIKRMWDGITAYPDYRGVMFGMGDGHEHEVGGGAFELAYYAFRDTAYAAVIKQGGSRDLLFGVPQLPVKTPLLYALSAHSDNAGIAVLRSQTSGREQKDQVQAAFKYGTHGGYHGHFDRLSLLSLMRYGRSFYNPETSWFGYGSYMYKWWVQPSVSHNMVVVDGKQQEPVESKPLIYHSGKMMQIIGAETIARWGNPPYFGGYDQLEKVKKGNAPYVPVPANHPDPAAVTGYTEPVLQRRLLIVTDDYVVMADYLKAGKEHVFDNLLQLRGARAGDNLTYVGHDAQYDTSALSSGQFITNINKYTGKRTVTVNSLMKTGNGKNQETGGQKSHSVPGDMHIDAYNAWPQNISVLIGSYAEAWPINKKLKYEVLGDGKLLATDSMGTWILGKGEVSADIKGIKTLQLRTYTDRKDNILNTLFWANAVLVTASGKEIKLSSLPASVSGIIATSEKAKDYDGGPVQIAGNMYSDVLAAEPLNSNSPGIISVDLSALNVVKLKALVGGDYPVGEEGQLRKTVGFRSKGKEASFLTVLEPYETSKMVKSVNAKSVGVLEVALADGRIQRITIEGLDTEEGKMSVKITELKNGKIEREEKSTYE